MTDTARLLWTGGWDSTFRLLQLLLVEGRPVEPHYIIGDRRSVYHEIRSMKQIKRRFWAQHPERRELLWPFRYCDKLDIPVLPSLTAAFEEVRQRQYLGSQYPLLASYCVHASVNSIELAIHRDDKAHAVLERFVRRKAPDAAGYVCDEAVCGRSELTLFGSFEFPIFDLTKLEMQRLARANGFEPYMALTWFCHSPRRDGLPCGNCAPCRYTIQEGLGRRVPLRGRLKYLRYQTMRWLRGLKGRLTGTTRGTPQEGEDHRQAEGSF
jgi:hypothetical protein